MLGELLVLADFLRVQEINLSVVKHFAVERLVVDCDALLQLYAVGLTVDFHARLLVEFGRITEPYEYGIGILGVICCAAIHILDERSHDDCLARTCGRGERNHLWRVGEAVVLMRNLSIDVETVNSFLLENKWFYGHRDVSYLAKLIRKLSR